MTKITVAGIDIGPDNKPFTIAEMSGNHNQSIDRALAIVDAAAATGANAIKLQTYTADTITMKGAYTITDKNSLWHGKELHDLYKQAYTPWEWHKEIFARAKQHGLIAFSSPFDTTSVDFLESLDVPIYKIASFENTDHILLKKVARTGKPVIMSTGVSTVADIYESVNVLKENGCKELILLKCTSTYPATPEDTNIITIPHMRQLFNCQVGLSDHTMGIGVAVASVALGATVIEKHFTLRRADGGVDSSFSLEPDEFTSLVTETERAWLSLGKINYKPTEKEKKSMGFKRSLFVARSLKKGDIITDSDVRSIRPSTGLHTRYYEQVIGKRVVKDVEPGTPMSFDLIE